MRQVLAIVAGGLLAAFGAVVLGEYPLRGATALVGFPLYGVAIAELALAVGRRLHWITLALVSALVAGGLSWALWISFGHFRNDVDPPALSWVMVGVAALAALAWGRSGRRRHRDAAPQGGTDAPTAPQGLAAAPQGEEATARAPRSGRDATADEEATP